MTASQVNSVYCHLLVNQQLCEIAGLEILAWSVGYFRTALDHFCVRLELLHGSWLMKWFSCSRCRFVLSSVIHSYPTWAHRRCFSLYHATLLSNGSATRRCSSPPCASWHYDNFPCASSTGSTKQRLPFASCFTTFHQLAGFFHLMLQFSPQTFPDALLG